MLFYLGFHLEIMKLTFSNALKKTIVWSSIRVSYILIIRVPAMKLLTCELFKPVYFLSDYLHRVLSKLILYDAVSLALFIRKDLFILTHFIIHKLIY